VIQSFANAETEAIYNNDGTKKARHLLDPSLWRIAQRKLEYMDSAAKLSDLRSPPGNQLEVLKHDRSGQYSIRINDQFRICFVWTGAGPANVEITEYH
jgi:proteic killer suppression protein